MNMNWTKLSSSHDPDLEQYVRICWILSYGKAGIQKKKCLARAELKSMYGKADQSVLHEHELNHALTAASHEAGLQTPVRLADTSALHELPLQQAGLHWF